MGPRPCCLVLRAELSGPVIFLTAAPCVFCLPWLCWKTRIQLPASLSELWRMFFFMNEEILTTWSRTGGSSRTPFSCCRYFCSSQCWCRGLAALLATHLLCFCPCVFEVVCPLVHEHESGRETGGFWCKGPRVRIPALKGETIANFPRRFRSQRRVHVFVRPPPDAVGLARDDPLAGAPLGASLFEVREPHHKWREARMGSGLAPFGCPEKSFFVPRCPMKELDFGIRDGQSHYPSRVARVSCEILCHRQRGGPAWPHLDTRDASPCSSVGRRMGSRHSARWCDLGECGSVWRPRLPLLLALRKMHVLPQV